MAKIGTFIPATDEIGAVYERRSHGADGGGDSDRVHDLCVFVPFLRRRGHASVVCARKRVSSEKNLLFMPT